MAYRSRHSLGVIQLAPLAGQLAGGVIGDLFSGHHHPATDIQYNATTPRGTIVLTYETAPSPPGAQMIFYQWAQAGHLDWLHSIATSGSGPKWTDPSGGTAYSGYGSADQAAALALYNAFSGVANPITGAPSQAANLPGQLAPAPAPAPSTSSAGVGLVLGVGIAAAVLVSLFGRGRGAMRRQNPGRAHRSRARSSRRSHHARRRR